MALSSVALVGDNIDTNKLILYAMVVVWALRLGIFLFLRIRKQKRDKRFDEMRNSLWKFGRFWLLQGASVYVILLACLFVWSKEGALFSWLNWIGLTIFLAGLLIESIADYQKRKFSAKSENKDKWIDTGLWSISRHPNYLGEMLVWVGVYTYAFSYLSISERLIGLLSPLYIICLLLFVSGIPLLEKAADQKWGENTEYKKYKKRTPILIPRIVKSR
jgi:steroid 5-alpha reductase family enzyme